MDALASPGRGSVFDLLDPEVYVISASDGERDGAMVATWVMPATLAPDHPRALVALSKASFTLELIRRSGRFVIQLLADTQIDLVPRLGGRSGRDGDKLKGVKLDRTDEGVPILEGTCGFAACRLVDAFDTGDRLICLGEIARQEIHEGRAPLRCSTAFARLPRAVVAEMEERLRRDAARDQAMIERLASGARPRDPPERP
jgi:flavin reductase (DIM6/NTAB) family NADH-FMN oxidoreductase RutF